MHEFSVASPGLGDSRSKLVILSGYVSLMQSVAVRVEKCRRSCPNLYKVVEVLRGGWTYRVSRLQVTGRKSDIKTRHYNDLVRPAAAFEEVVPRDDTDTASASDGESRSASSDENSDTGSEDHDRMEPAGNSPRPRRACGPPARLVVDPSRSRYEET